MFALNSTQFNGLYTFILIILGDILFSRLPHIHSLQIQGYIANNSAQEFLDGIVYTDGNFKLRGQTIFKNNANIEKNIKVIGKTNNINLPAFVSDMVMITKDATIKSFVRFTKPSFIQHNMIVNNKLKTHNLNNIDFKSWMENAIFVDKGLLKGLQQVYLNTKVNILIL